ncbi:MAG: hypothetical protein KJN90_10230 [Gammaproteobacteria bacterium]|nr:hypothetical protein [Gammaproteobacteria bacterium]
MNAKVIELNDSAVSVSDESGLLVQSPGFAVIGERGLEVGRAAEQQVRLRPTSSFNKFWHQLSLEPLGYSVGNIRHFADLAFAHLLHVADEAQLDGDVIFAVPGNFTSQQLAILLGLARQCPFSPIGVVDAALASAVKLVEKPNLVFADIQLHQALVTRFSIVDGNLQRESVIQIPEAGLQSFNNLVMQLATGLFVQQCRFNPQHNAESEQQLYNALPEWLAQYGKNRSSLLMEINTGNAVHQAKVPWETLIQKFSDFYGRIYQQIDSVSKEPDTQLVISSSLAKLPSFINAMSTSTDPGIAVPESLGKTCLELEQYINSDDDGFHFVTALPLVGEVQAAQAPGRQDDAAGQAAVATHVLYKSHALPLGKVTISNDREQDLKESINGKNIQLSIAGLPAYLGQIEREGNQVSVVCGEAGALLNGEKITGRQNLKLGDLVQFTDNSEAISLIRVRDGIE